jgi:hypothetical protein
MTLATAELLVHLLEGYAATGALFAALFLWRWVARLDPAAAHATWGFRVLVFPVVVLFWPLFALRLARRSRQAKAAPRPRIEILR